MKKTALKKDIFREIKKTLSRFLSILCIVGLGAGFFTGIKGIVPSMQYTADRYFNQYNMMDLRLLSTAGFGGDDAQAVKELPHIQDVMPSYSLDALSEDETGSFVVSVHALPEEEKDWIDRVNLTAGRLPEQENECLVFASPLHNSNTVYALGDTVTLLPTAGETKVDDVLSTREFTVTGIVTSVKHFSFDYGSSTVGDGSVSLLMYIPEKAFTYERYTELYVTLDRHGELSAYSDEYKALVEEVTASLETLGVTRYTDYIARLQAELDDAERELNEESAKAEGELADAKAELDDAAIQIEDGLQQLADGWEQYRKGLIDAEELIAEYEEIIADSKQEILDGKQQIADGWTELEENRLLAEEEFAKAEAQLKDARAQLDDGWAQWESGLIQYEDGLAQYEAGKAEYEDGLAQYEEGLAQFQPILDAVEQADALLAGGKNAIAAANGFSAAGSSFLAAYRQGGDLSLSYDGLCSAGDALLASLQSDDPVAEALVEQFAHTRVENITSYAAAMLAGEDTAAEEALAGELNEMGGMLSSGEDAYTLAEEAAARAEEELSVYTAQLEEAKAQLDAAKLQLDEAKQQLDAAAKQIDDGKTELENGEWQYEQGLKEFEAQKADALQQFAEGEQKLVDGEAELLDGEAKLAEAEEQLAKAKAEAQRELATGRQELLNAEAELADAKARYEEGLLQYADGAAEADSAIADGRKRIADAKGAFADIKSGQWYVFDRNDAVNDYKDYTDDVARVDAIAAVFPVFFLLVAALVCLTTMSRMVEEQRTQMGTYKALGYSKRSIAGKFVIYALIASVIGSILGQVLFINLIPRIAATAYQVMYHMPDLELTVPWGSIAMSTASSLACTVCVALFCCMKELRTATAQLMRPKTPKAGKKILLERCVPLWKKLNFSQKITARNLFRYKVRLMMTVLGIGGSMSLMVAGFGLQDAILPLSEMQFGHIATYDVILASTAEYDEAAAEQLRNTLLEDERITSAVITRQVMGDAASEQSDKTVVDVAVFVPDDPAALTSIINTYEYKTGELLPLTDDEVFITQKMAEQLNTFAGDTLTFHSGEESYEVTVTAVLEHYLAHYIYLSPKGYEKIFGEAPVYNSAALKTDKTLLAASGGESEFTAHWLEKDPDLLSVTFIGDAASTFASLMDSLNVIVLVLIVCAGALAFIVVYNLTNINISERLREIATLKVLGFTHKEVNLYIFRESILMSIAGILLGILGGWGLTVFIVRTVEVDVAMFVRKVELTSYLISALLTAVFTVLVNFVMAKKIKKISMVESLKAVE